MKKSFVILLLITSLFISCNPEIYIEEQTPPVEEIERDIISNLANKYVDLIDIESILSESINATSVNSDTISIVSDPVVTENSIVFTVEFLGSNNEELPTKRDVVQLTDEISAITELKGFLTISLDGLTINEDGTKKFLTYSYKLSSPSIDKPLIISDDKNKDVEVYLYETFVGDVFAELSINNSKLDILSESLLATPMIPLKGSYLLVNWNEAKMEDICNKPEFVEKQELIKAKIKKIEAHYIVQDLLLKFKEEQLRYSIATLNKEIGPIKDSDLSEAEKLEAEKINALPNCGISEYFNCMDVFPTIFHAMAIAKDNPGLCWMTPVSTDFTSSSGLKLNGLYLALKQCEDGNKVADIIMDITFVDDTRKYFDGGSTILKAGSRVYLAMNDCTYAYMGEGVGTGDNLQFTAKTYNISTNPEEVLSGFINEPPFTMPEKGSISISYKDQIYSLDINNIEGEADIYTGLDIRKNPIALKGTVKLNSIGTPTSYDITFDGQNITSTTTL